MNIDLNNKVIRAVVQEYTNAIVNFGNEEELNFDVHKLIHTFQVLETAQELIKLTSVSLSTRIKKQILNAAVLHDIGRCHEFLNGRRCQGYNHGSAGATLVKRYFPNLSVESECTKWHNQSPSEKDPPYLFPVLDYVRDADILANLRYNAENISVFVKHIYLPNNDSSAQFEINNEIKDSVTERRSCIYHRMEKFDFWDMLVAQLLWIYNLRTESGFRYAKKFDVFRKFRYVITTEVLELISGPLALKKKAAQEIMTLFPDSFFDKEFKRHGL